MRTLTARELQHQERGREATTEQRFRAERIADLKEAIAIHDEQIAMLKQWIAEEETRRDQYRAKLTALGVAVDLT